MKFSEEKAQEIKATHGVPLATIRTWRRRGAIPDAYSGPPIERVNDPGLVDLLSHPYIFATLVSVGNNHFKGVATGKAPFYPKERKAARKYLRDMADRLRRWAGKESGVRRFLGGGEPAVKKQLVLDVAKKLYWRHYKNPECSIREDEIANVSEQFILLAEHIDSYLQNNPK